MTAEKISQDLVALAPKLTPQDKMKLCVAANRSLPTISRYLRGAVKDPLAGSAILKEAQRIVDRKEKLSA